MIASLLKEREEFPKAKPFSTGQRLVSCFLCALIPVTVCSQYSFLYPLNDWVDVNCFITVGKSWMHGMIPCRDLIDQKGLYLYLLYGIASLFSAKGYIGAWLIEVLSGITFLYYSGKTAALYTGQDRGKESSLYRFYLC